MGLSPGARLGVYEIRGALGAGGMGEVYRARDTRLNREVAVKVLSEHLSADPAALARFEREAQAVAALSHPNILALYEFGESEGTVYAVSELLEGETLRARLSGGALPVRKALEYAIHIVRGIAAAHERGIVHRDLKPENIFVTNDGVVKILDFGLAKPLEVAPALQETKIGGDTTPGTVMGTVGYMSPEQVRGQVVDQRTDIFSFGAVLYEMLAGRRAFVGHSHVETMNAILKEDPPDLTTSHANLPVALDRIVRLCLEKQPAERFHSAHDLAMALEAISGASSHSEIIAAPSTAALPAWRRPTWLMAAGLTVVAIAGVVLGRATVRAPAPALPNFHRVTFRRGPVFGARIAPDGGSIVYAAAFDGASVRLFSSRRDTPDSLALPYPDSDLVGISAKGDLALVTHRQQVGVGWVQPGTLARAPLAGGAERDLLDRVQDADWLPDGSNLIVAHLVGTQFQLEAPIGTVVYTTEGWISHPRVSADGRIAFLDHPVFGDDGGSVALLDGSGTKHTLGPNFASVQGLAWAPGGKELWMTGSLSGSERALWAVTLAGQVREVWKVPGSLTLGDITPSGEVLLVRASMRRGFAGLAPGATSEQDLSWFDWPVLGDLSADGREVLFSEQGDGGGPGYGVFLRRTDGSPAVRLSAGAALALSPDGKWALVMPLEKGGTELLLVPTGAGDARPLPHGAIRSLSAWFTADGRAIVFAGSEPQKQSRAWLQPIEGGPPRPITPEGNFPLAVSPDGAHLATRSNGRYLIYPLAGGVGEPIKGLAPDEEPFDFTSDSHNLWTRRPLSDDSLQVSRLDPTTGVRSAVRKITPPPESLGIGGITTLLMTPDGKSYVYGYGVQSADIYLVKGLH